MKCPQRSQHNRSQLEPTDFRENKAKVNRNLAISKRNLAGPHGPAADHFASFFRKLMIIVTVHKYIVMTMHPVAMWMALLRAACNTIASVGSGIGVGINEIPTLPRARGTNEIVSKTIAISRTVMGSSLKEEMNSDPLIL